MDLFSLKLEENLAAEAPLAERMRPSSLEEFFGQKDIVGKGGFLRRVIQSDRIPSMIFYGPPGTGKTTLAYIIAQTTKMMFEKLSAVTDGIKELRSVLDRAKFRREAENLRTILFIDEIHRYNKSQQDALLPAVEKGIVILIGATTENPFFEVNSALLSRMTILQLSSLSREDLSGIIKRAIVDKEKGLGDYAIELEHSAEEYFIRTADGDARTLLNGLEIAALSTDEKDGKIFIDLKVAKNSMQTKHQSYDRTDDEHYNTASAFIKSMRGSDPDAALYWLAKMIVSGEDPKFIARRIMILAAEDIGLADPNALTVAVSCFQTVHVIGFPEARIPLAEAVIYMSTAPKSNTAYLAIDKAICDVKNEELKKVPKHLRDGSYIGAKKLGNAIGYKYPHDYPDKYVVQSYLPEGEEKKYYEPLGLGYEKNICEYLKKISDIKNSR